MAQAPARILMVEDNPTDVMIINAALQRLSLALDVKVVTDGRMALDYLSGKRPYGDRTVYPLPHLILLDLGLPHVNGFQVLEWIRTHPDLRFTPVIILATSNFFTDIEQAYAFGANSFITKPADLNKLVLDLKTAFQFWLVPPAAAVQSPEQPLASEPPPG